MNGRRRGPVGLAVLGAGVLLGLIGLAVAVATGDWSSAVFFLIGGLVIVVATAVDPRR